MKKEHLVNAVMSRLVKDDLTYIAILVQQGKDTEVKKLTDSSASNALSAIYGYAIEGDTDKVKDLLTLTGTKHFKAGIQHAIKGFIRGGKPNLVRRLPNFHEHMSSETMLTAYALMENHSQVNVILRREGTQTLMQTAVTAYASTGQYEKTLTMLSISGSLYRAAIIAAAKSAQFELVEAISEQFSESRPAGIDEQQLKQHAISGYCQGGHFKHAAELISTNLEISTALMALKLDGNIDMAAYELLLTCLDGELFEAAIKQINTELDCAGQPKVSATQIEEIKAFHAQLEASSCKDVADLLLSQDTSIYEPAEHSPKASL